MSAAVLPTVAEVIDPNQQVGQQKNDVASLIRYLTENIGKFTTTGTGSAYVGIPVPAITEYFAGLRFRVKFTDASQDNATLQVSALLDTPPQLVKRLGDGSVVNIRGGDIPAGHESMVIWLSATQALVEELPFAVAGPSNTPLTDRQKLLNGAFKVNSRGVTSPVTLAAGEYGHDGWKAGSGGCTYSFSVVNNKVTVTITSGTLAPIIDGGDIETGFYTLSYLGTSQARILAGAYGVSPRHSGVLPGGSNVSVEFGIGTIADVLFEPGTTPTPFPSRLTTLERLLCEQRLPRTKGRRMQGWAVNSTTAVFSIDFRPQTRADITGLTVTNPTTNIVEYGGAGSVYVSSIALVSGDDCSARVNVVVASPVLTADRPVFFVPDASSKWIFSGAEL